MFAAGYDDIGLLCSQAARMADHDRRVAATVVEGPANGHREQLAQAALMRDIFGNPFHPAPVVDAAWNILQTRVRDQANAAYEVRRLPEGDLDPVRLTLLADALEDAGCTDAELLGHLRSPGPHVRGCWAVDLVLGRK